MTAITGKLLTLEEYFKYDDGTDSQYELMAGELVAMPPESPKNVQISLFLLVNFLKFVPVNRLSNKVEIVVAGSRATTRIPDLVVLTDELATILEGATRSTITLDMPPPALVVEVVSPGKANEDRDYRYKRSEYAARGITEYWIVDPQINAATVLILVNGFYEETRFAGNTAIASTIFPGLHRTAITPSRRKEYTQQGKVKS
ncbi:MAG: Uma2 family endonuclease [Nostoc sp. EfeVER01]|uniref:Uma2 family endonuclease n=1 Tax=unclassified Nostoc TaxID=2593658 RepID=UPI002AD3E174|nr:MULTISPECIES: Uma2 family endonuclease [unclassified Nostoc]MDZ7949226.1 Uma2 family endonuclease [Nostoc sp. EfeVER01]MDZ7994525.1 Uma2 family endonuclease [Nostoc sp. EspVER01]